MQKRKRALSGFLALILLLIPFGTRAAADPFFEDAVFLGDSITVGLEKYVTSKRKTGDCLSDARFLATNGYMVSHTGDPDGYEKHPLYDGDRIQPHSAIRKLDPKRVFILMGINDAAGDANLLLDQYASMLSRIRDAAPKAEIYMLAVFPMCAAREDGKRNNAKIQTINTGLLRLAMREGVSFIDVTPALKNGSGALDPAYSSDQYVHINNDGYDVYLAQLRKAADFFQKDGGDEATVVNVQNYVNARNKPSTQGKLLTTIKKGETVKVLERQGSWCKVAYAGRELYVSAKYLSGGGLSGRVVNVSSFANLRSLPDSESELKGKADKDSTLEISQAYYSPRWYRVLSGGSHVFISRTYLNMY